MLRLLGVLIFQVSDQPAWEWQRVQEFYTVFPNGFSNLQPAKVNQGSWRFWKKEREMLIRRLQPAEGLHL